MNRLQRSVAAAMLIFPVVGSAQTVGRPEWRMYGYDRALSQGDERAAGKPLFFYYLDSGFSRLDDGHLLVATQDVPVEALKPIDPRSKAAIRRRTALRIASGYEPPLAHLIASTEETTEILALNQKLAPSELAGAHSRALYEIDCDCQVLRLRRRDPVQSWQDAPPDTRQGALVKLACAAAAPRQVVPGGD